MRIGTMIFALVCFQALYFTDANAQPAPEQRSTRAQTPKPTAQGIAESGKYQDNVYSNDLLKFSVGIPSGWNLVSEEVNRNLLDKSWKDIRKSESKKYDYGASQSNTKVLFQAHSPGDGGPTSVYLISLGLELLATAQSVESYASFNRDVLKRVLSGKPTSDFYYRTIGEERFLGFDIDVVSNGIPMNQTYLITRRQDLMLFFILTAPKGSSATSEFDAALNTVKFTR